MQESLSRVHPRMRASWLRERGLDDSYYTTFRKPESSGLREVGRWPWGPSWELAGRDTFLYLGSGSGVRILSISDSVRPRMLGQIVCRGLVSQVVVQDTLLFVACGGWGAQVYSVADPASPRELGSMDAPIGDLCVKDTFCYTVGGDSLRIYNVANPTSPFLVGAKRDSGDLIVVANGHAFCAGRWVTNIYNVTNPASPVWVNSLGGPRYAMFIRRNLLFCTAVQPDYMAILNAADPLNIYQVSRVNGYGGDDVSANDSFAYLSGNYEHSGLFVIDVSDSSRPVLRDSINPEGVTEWETYVPNGSSYGYLADDYGGLVTVDLHDVNTISEAWSGYKADQAVDICIDGQRAYVANDYSGLQIVDVSNPTLPASLGIFDTVGAKSMPSAVGRDSFAFVSMRGITGRRFLRVLEVLDPSDPTVVAQESCFNAPEDMILRDSFIYAAEGSRFQVFNVARPREPVRVGSCVLPGSPSDLVIHDTVAYASRYIVSIARPDSPAMLGSIPGSPGGAIAIRDSFAFAPAQYDSLVVVNVARPSAAFRVASLVLSGGHIWNSGAALAEDTVLYIGGDIMHVVNVTDASNPREVASWRPPYDIRRVTYSPPYVYAACFEAGVCVLESVQVGLMEPGHPVGRRPSWTRVHPVPAAAAVAVTAAWVPDLVVLRDVTGRVVRSLDPRGSTFTVNLDGLRSGLFFCELRKGDYFETVKLIKR